MGIKISGPNKKLEHTIMISKIKRSDTKNVKTVAEKVIQPFIELSIQGINMKEMNSKISDLQNSGKHDEMSHKDNKRSLHNKNSTSSHSPQSKKVKVVGNSQKIPSSMSVNESTPKKANISSDKLVNVPSNVKKHVNDNDMVYQVAGNGACGANAAAVHIFKDENYGLNLRRNINTHLLAHWKFYQNKISFPYNRKVGNGNSEVNFDSHEEFLKFLKESPDSDFLWMDSEDLLAICNLYQLKIKVVSFKGPDDDNTNVTFVCPDDEMKLFAWIPAGTLEDIVLLHKVDSHFDLVISGSSNSNLETSLENMDMSTGIYTDFMDFEEDEPSFSYKDETMTESYTKILDDNELINYISTITLRSKDDESYECKICDSSVTTAKLMIKHITEHVDDGDLVCNQCDFQSNSMKSFKNHVNTQHKKVFSCELCDHVTNTELKLKTHIVSHEKVFKCDKCVSVLKSKDELVSHKIKSHKSFKPCNNYKTNSCKFGDTCLFNHVTLSEGQLICFDCGLTFIQKGDLMKHRKLVHGNVEVCRNFQSNKCRFTSESCWWSHLGNDVGKKVQNQDFQQAPQNLAPPSTLEEVSRQLAKVIQCLIKVGMLDQISL